LGVGCADAEMVKPHIATGSFLLTPS